MLMLLPVLLMLRLPLIMLHIIDAYSDFLVSLPCDLLVYKLDMTPKTSVNLAVDEVVLPND